MIEKFEIMRGNALIAKFMDFPTKELSGRLTDGLKLSIGYDTDWRMLMPVLEKIEKNVTVEIRGNINFQECRINTQSGLSIHRLKEKKITVVWLAVVAYLDSLEYTYHKPTIEQSAPRDTYDLDVHKDKDEPNMLNYGEDMQCY